MRKAPWIALLSVVLVALLLLVPYLIPAESYRQELEQTLSEQLGRPVRVAELHLTLLPPGAEAKGVAVGEVTLARLALNLRTSALLRGEIEIPAVVLEGLAGEAAALAALAPPSDASAGSSTTKEAEGDTPAVHVERVTLRDLRLSHKGAPLGRYDGELHLDEQGQPREARLYGEGLEATALAVERGFDIHVEGRDWRPPLAGEAVVESVRGDLTLRGENLAWKGLELAAYDGKLVAEGSARLAAAPQAEARFTLDGLRLAPLLKALGHGESLDGRLSSDGNATLKGGTPALQANFSVVDGIIHDADLERAARDMATSAQTGGQTPFDQLKGRLAVNGDDVALRDLSITSSSLEASGRLDIRGRKNLDGVIDVGLKGATMVAGVPLAVSGTLDKPELMLTKAAMAGAAAGTALLGPGVGTAVGVKAGQALEGLRSLFGGDDKK